MERYRKRRRQFAPILKATGLIIIALGMLYNFAIYLRLGLVSDLITVRMIAYSWLPYIMCLFLVILRINPRILLCGVIAPFFFDLIMYTDIVTSTSSTAAIGLIFIPIYDLVLIMPAGLIAGVIIVLIKNEKIFPRKSI